jgi:hypothetical protein
VLGDALRPLEITIESSSWTAALFKNGLKWGISWHCPFKNNVWVPGRSLVVHPTEKNCMEVEAKKPGKN